ncbi:hypothetical protein AAG570_009906 [Ranatra chinensis]|uniref:Uncharacterized protein n=1 Tax=Ranatra chinensis TaxID=642074 RepID=A0ABD0YQF8_9HEMI
MASKRRNMLYENKKQETTEIGQGKKVGSVRFPGCHFNLNRTSLTLSRHILSVADQTVDLKSWRRFSLPRADIQLDSDLQLDAQGTTQYSSYPEFTDSGDESVVEVVPRHLGARSVSSCAQTDAFLKYIVTGDETYPGVIFTPENKRMLGSVFAYAARFQIKFGLLTLRRRWLVEVRRGPWVGPRSWSSSPLWDGRSAGRVDGGGILV